MAAVVWFRRDLRLEDNPAWTAATRAHDSVLPLFVLDKQLWDHAGPYRGPQLAAHLAALDGELAALGGRLRVVHGDPVAVLPGLATEAVYWNADYSPFAVNRDTAVSAALPMSAAIFHGSVVHEPGTILTKAGTPFQVFTPFSKAWSAAGLAASESPGEATIAGDYGDGIPTVDVPVMEPGEQGAHNRLADFLERVDQYDEIRNRPDLDATSRLSADLKFGTLSPRQVLEVVGDATPGRRAFVRQLCWRDFWAQIMFHQPHTATQPMRPEYSSIEWQNDQDDFAAWQRGATGYPIVDAGMRQLQKEGWMHNRVRLIAASFLVKHLLIDWRWGERHFRNFLVDGDVAQNVGNWQWVAGTGADAAPYFRIFNPVTQSKKFDPEGAYVKRYLPELDEVPARLVHAPWEAAESDLAAAGVTLGKQYPPPIVDHRFARERVLSAYAAARG